MVSIIQLGINEKKDNAGHGLTCLIQPARTGWYLTGQLDLFCQFVFLQLIGRKLVGVTLVKNSPLALSAQSQGVVASR